MHNIEIRNILKQKRILHYEVAEKIGISESTFSVWLRKPLNDKRKKKVLQAIKDIQQEIK